MPYQNISVEEFRTKMEEPETVILDVRAPQELEEGEVAGHVMINIMSPDFQSKIHELDRKKTFLVYCRSGVRSANACAFMESLGFLKLYNLSGGIKAWNSAQKS